MRKKTFYSFLAISAISLFIVSILFFYFLNEYNLTQTENNMKYSIELIDYGLDYSKDLQKQVEEIEPIVSQKNTRITIIDKKGTVYADTNTSIDSFDNHSERPEFVEAIKNGFGINIRYSESLKRELFYIAKLSKNKNYIIRIAIPYLGKTMFLNALIPSLIISVVCAFFCTFLFAKKFAESITKPLTDISNEVLKIQANGENLNFKKYDYEELNNIINSIKILSDRVDNNFRTLKYEKNKIDYILNNMNEGIIVLDYNKNILLVNKAAANAVRGIPNMQNKSILHFTRNMEIIDAVQNVIDNDKDSVFDITSPSGKILSVHVTKIKKGIFENISEGIVIFMVDVTSDRETQKLRQEFFSNVSHELKTPITSIQGYAELLNSGILYDLTQRQEFLERIQTETRNMTNLINDILTISKLEAGTEKKDFSPIELNPLLKEILQTLKPEIDKRNLSINISCEDCVFKGNYSQIYQLLSNLIGNAVKYNKQDGNVAIKINEDEKNLYIKIYDTGIGIPEESVSRVFERFYRVDKGRSKRIGGTGLGLSIVKHIVNFYSGIIKFTSKLDKGTKVEITLPLQ